MLFFSLTNCLLDLSKILKIKMYKTLKLPVVLYSCVNFSYIKNGTQAKVFKDRLLSLNEYLVLIEMRLRTREVFTTRKFIVYIISLIY